VVFGQDDVKSFQGARSTEFATIFKAHAGKSSMCYEDEGEEFLLSNGNPSQTSPRDGHRIGQFGVRKYPYMQPRALARVLPDGDKASECSRSLADSYNGFAGTGSWQVERTKRFYPQSHGATSVGNLLSGGYVDTVAVVSPSPPHTGRQVNMEQWSSRSINDVVFGGPQDVKRGSPETGSAVIDDVSVCSGSRRMYPQLSHPLPPPPDETPDQSVLTPSLVPVPTLFVSHGQGPFPLQWDADHPVVKSFRNLADSALSCMADGVVKVVLVVSAHWETDDGVEVTFKAGSEPQHLFYDYCGFSEEMYKLPYGPKGSPALSKEAVALLRARGLRAKANMDRRLDHGVFVPLMLMPALEGLPVVQVSLPRLGRDWEHDAYTALEIGRALSPLRRKGVLIIGSGQSTSTHRTRSDAAEFSESLTSICTSVDLPSRAISLQNWRRMLPCARDVHSREEHLLPLLVAAGAAEDEVGSVQGNLWSGQLSLTHYRFGSGSLAKPEETIDPRMARLYHSLANISQETLVETLGDSRVLPAGKVAFGAQPLDFASEEFTQMNELESRPSLFQDCADLRHAASSKSAWRKVGVAF
jgi:aromatic ring-opening dioxygenase catalytic subunit (LigB family)